MSQASSDLANSIRGPVPALTGAALAFFDAYGRERPERASAYLRIFQQAFNAYRAALVVAAGRADGAAAAGDLAAGLPARLVVDGVWGANSRRATLGVLVTATVGAGPQLRPWVGRMPDVGAPPSRYNSWGTSRPIGSPLINCVTGSMILVDTAPDTGSAAMALSQWVSAVARATRSACPTVDVPESRAPGEPSTQHTQAPTTHLPAAFLTGRRTTPGAQWPWLVVGAGVLGLIGYFAWQKVRT